MLTNSAAAVQVYLACAAIGAIWVGLNPAAPAAERDRQCSLVRPEVIVTDRASAWHPPTGRIVETHTLFDGDTAPFDGDIPDLDQPCAIGFSSGTTGTPKALVHTRRAVSLTATAYAENTLRGTDRVGVILPMSIHNLMVVGALPVLIAGATVIPVERMNARGVATACLDSRLTLLNALVPATIYDLVHDDVVTPSALATLRYAGTGAAGLSEALRGEFEDKFGVNLVGTYGMTEAPGVVCSEDPDLPHRPGSSGWPLPHLDVVACDPSGQTVPARAEGELTVRATQSGPYAHRYRPAIGTWTEDGLARRAAGRDLHTGDYGWVDEDGAVYVTGRTAEMLVRGGVSVNAAELESVLGQLPDVRGVAVIGEPDERLGQRIVAFAEATADTTLDPVALREQARAVLAHGKVPDEFVVATLPRNAMGKVQRALLHR